MPRTSEGGTLVALMRPLTGLLMGSRGSNPHVLLLTQTATELLRLPRALFGASVEPQGTHSGDGMGGLMEL